MINVAHVRAAAAAMPGDVVTMTKAQLAELLADLELGLQARRSLTNIKSVVAIAASTVGAPA